MAQVLSSSRTIIHALLGIWLGLWTISGIAIGTGGVLILAIECYGWLYLGLWLSVTPAGLLRKFAIVVPTAPIESIQFILDRLLHLPVSVMFIWCGFHIAVMAWIARKRLERRMCPMPNRLAKLLGCIVRWLRRTDHYVRIESPY